MQNSSKIGYSGDSRREFVRVRSEFAPIWGVLEQLAAHPIVSPSVAQKRALSERREAFWRQLFLSYGKRFVVRSTLRSPGADGRPLSDERHGHDAKKDILAARGGNTLLRFREYSFYVLSPVAHFACRLSIDSFVENVYHSGLFGEIGPGAGSPFFDV